MTLIEFQNSLHQAEPPTVISPLLRALWFDGKNRWTEAHEIVQDMETKDAAAIHAYLHRKEGDAGNARYWYQRAGLPFFTNSLEEEWQSLALKLLKHT
jgi:hypothetical protein